MRDLHRKGNSRGIYSILLDGVEVGTIDGYKATDELNALATVAGVAVAATRKKRLTLKMATKHASSSAYIGTVHAVG